MFLNNLKAQIEKARLKTEEAVEFINSKDAENRMQICNQCEFLIKPLNQCKECGCLMNIKTKLINAKCPKGKW